MHEIHTLKELLRKPLPRDTHCAIGVFDGVHCGHQELLRRMIRGARESRAAPLVFTFCNHPLELLAPPYAPKRLMSLEHKCAVLESLGVEWLIMLEFNARLAKLPAERFVREVLLAACRMQKIYCGFNFRFGHRGAGSAEDLRRWAREGWFAADICEAVAAGGQLVSSSHIRGLLIEGRVAAAAQLLSRPYELDGRVVPGRRRGHSLGFPTANLQVDSERQLPGSGVYAIAARVEERWRGGMLNLGPAPTFGEEQQRVEAHLFDFSGELYGRVLPVRFLDLIRGVRRFDSAEQLIAQLKRDEIAARKICGAYFNAALEQDAANLGAS